MFQLLPRDYGVLCGRTQISYLLEKSFTIKLIKSKDSIPRRIKITAFISTSELRSEGIKVKVHVQKLKNNIWSDTYLDKELANQIENNILNEARNLRINSLK